MNADLRLPCLEIQKLTQGMPTSFALDRDEGTASSVSAMSFRPHESVFDVTSTTSAETTCIITAFDWHPATGTADRYLRELFRSSADTSSKIVLVNLSGSLTLQPWADLIRRKDQANRNRQAIALLDSWLEETDAIDADEVEDWERVKADLDAHRTSNRKLFP